MPKRATCGYSRHIIIALGISLALLVPGRTAYAQEKPTTSAKQTCLVKYSTLSALMCDTPALNTTVAPLANAVEPTKTPTPKEEKKKEESPIREMKGIRKEYLYTDRVTHDKTGWYTKMRSAPDEDSKRLEILRPGDKIRVLKDNRKNWYYVQIFQSHDKKLEGKEGWIERWLVDNVNVPKEPTPTPTTEKKQESESASSSSGAVANASVSGDGEALFNMVNDYRSSNGLPKFEKSDRLCSIAAVRAPEIAGEVATGTIHAGFQARGYGYPTAVENAAGYGNIQANFNWWLNSSLHRGSILGPDLKYSCVECKDGNCVQIFSINP